MAQGGTLSSVRRGLWGGGRHPRTVGMGGEAVPVRPAEELGFFPVPERKTFPECLGLKPTKRATRSTFRAALPHPHAVT